MRDELSNWQNLHMISFLSKSSFSLLSSTSSILPIAESASIRAQARSFCMYLGRTEPRNISARNLFATASRSSSSWMARQQAAFLGRYRNPELWTPSLHCLTNFRWSISNLLHRKPLHDSTWQPLEIDGNEIQVCKITTTIQKSKRSATPYRPRLSSSETLIPA